jgi:hypothetical protein
VLAAAGQQEQIEDAIAQRRSATGQTVDQAGRAGH